MIVAAYRIERQIEAVLAEQRNIEAEHQRAEADAKRASRGIL